MEETFESAYNCDETRYEIHMQTSSMSSSCKFMSQGMYEWNESPGTLGHSIFCMFELSKQFANNLESKNDDWIDIWVYDTVTKSNMANVHLVKPPKHVPQK